MNIPKEYELAYEVSIARQRKLHCAPSESGHFSFENGAHNHAVLSAVTAHLETWYMIEKDSLWSTGRSESMAARKARGAMVRWLNREGLPLKAIARLMKISIPSVKWGLNHECMHDILKDIKLKVFDNG